MSTESKINYSIILDEYNSNKYLDIYTNAALNIGLMNSEKIIIQEHSNIEFKVLDLGCGAGRLAFGLYDIGYRNICGIDIANEMIKRAKLISSEKGYDIEFIHANAENIPYDNSIFDLIVFSFNGLMTTPDLNRRNRICDEVYRVLKNQGVFIFTAHDRNFDEKSKKYWMKEQVKWESNQYDACLIDFGDRIFKDDGFNTFIHIPDDNEIINMLKQSGFSIVGKIRKSDIAEEKEEASKFSDDYYFWIAKK